MRWMISFTLFVTSLAWAAGGGGGSMGGAGGNGNVSATQKLKQQLDTRQWDAALATLETLRAKDRNNADWWNWTGYAERKRGNLDAAFPAYRQALKLNPAHLGAHEYLGEAYLQNSQPAEAEQELATLQKLCGNCDEYRDLAEALADYRSKNPAQ
ncbi:tetratricopeptide repeat protein [Andreprevotia sp. IGB-42]|uniref:tetratricopeptide repeat protein n=1 Tax=Andreprevotia sp. IGB-42 TaxID=2497473 RepID=UPI00135B2AEB|nr:tetratricopeptide repeat protein [Andreprevotia sp. IGB-42]